MACAARVPGHERHALRAKPRQATQWELVGTPPHSAPPADRWQASSTMLLRLLLALAGLGPGLGPGLQGFQSAGALSAPSRDRDVTNVTNASLASLPLAQVQIATLVENRLRLRKYPQGEAVSVPLPSLLGLASAGCVARPQAGSKTDAKTTRGPVVYSRLSLLEEEESEGALSVARGTVRGAKEPRREARAEAALRDIWRILEDLLKAVINALRLLLDPAPLGSYDLSFNNSFIKYVTTPVLCSTTPWLAVASSGTNLYRILFPVDLSQSGWLTGYPGVRLGVLRAVQAKLTS